MHLQCCCCGEYAGNWEQHWNRDDGYGVCASCVEDLMQKRGVTRAQITDWYGKEGVNWGAKPK